MIPNMEHRSVQTQKRVAVSRYECWSLLFLDTDLLPHSFISRDCDVAIQLLVVKRETRNPETRFEDPFPSSMSSHHSRDMPET